jgi:hypothetical protein
MSKRRRNSKDEAALNHSFKDLLDTSMYKEFAILSSDDYWIDNGSRNNEKSAEVGKKFVKLPEIADSFIDRSCDFPFDGKFEVSITPCKKYFDCRFELRDFYKHEYTQCLRVYQSVGKNFEISYSDFSQTFLTCVCAERLDLLGLVISAYFEHCTSKLFSEKDCLHLLGIVVRVVLDSRFSPVLDELVRLGRLFIGVDISTMIVLVAELDPILRSHPFRSMVVGDYFCLISHNLAALFYDCLLDRKETSDFSLFFMRELELFDHVNPTSFERLLLCFWRLTCTEKKDVDGCELMRVLRKTKGNLSSAVSSSAVEARHVITSISGFLVGNILV